MKDITNLFKPIDIANVILITHKGCMDGSGCAILFKKVGGKKENIRFIAAGTTKEFIKNNKDVVSNKFLLFADIGLDVETANTLEKRGSCIVIDHHNSSLFLEKRSWCYIDTMNEACGSELLRRYFEIDNDVNVKDMITLIDDRDRWKNKYIQSDELALLHNWLGQERFVYQFKEGLLPNTFVKYADIIEVLKESRCQDIVSANRNIIKLVVDIESNRVNIGYIINDKYDVSYVSNALLKQHLELDVMAAINFKKRSIELRSRDDGYDVSKLAKLFGGGGHKTASGHFLPSDFVKNMIGEIHV